MTEFRQIRLWKKEGGPPKLEGAKDIKVMRMWPGTEKKEKVVKPGLLKIQTEAEASRRRAEEAASPLGLVKKTIKGIFRPETYTKGFPKAFGKILPKEAAPYVIPEAKKAIKEVPAAWMKAVEETFVPLKLLNALDKRYGVSEKMESLEKRIDEKIIGVRKKIGIPTPSDEQIARFRARALEEIAEEDERSEVLRKEHPVIEITGNLVGDLANIYVIGRIFAPLTPYTSKVLPAVNVMNKWNVVMRGILSSIPAGAATFGTIGLLKEAAEEIEEGKFSPSDLITETVRGVGYGTALSFAYGMPTIRTQVGFGGIIGSGWPTLEILLTTGEFTKEDVVTVAKSGAVAAFFILLGARQRAESFQRNYSNSFNRYVFEQKIGKNPAHVMSQLDSMISEQGGHKVVVHQTKGNTIILKGQTPKSNLHLAYSLRGKVYAAHGFKENVDYLIMKKNPAGFWEAITPKGAKLTPDQILSKSLIPEEKFLFQKLIQNVVDSNVFTPTMERMLTPEPMIREVKVKAPFDIKIEPKIKIPVPIPKPMIKISEIPIGLTIKKVKGVIDVKKTLKDTEETIKELEKEKKDAGDVAEFRDALTILQDRHAKENLVETLIPEKLVKGVPIRHKRIFEKDIKEIQSGVKIPLIAEFKEGRYHLLDGNHRLAAYRELGIEKVPIITQESAFIEPIEVEEIKTMGVLVESRQTDAVKEIARDHPKAAKVLASLDLSKATTAKEAIDTSREALKPYLKEKGYPIETSLKNHFGTLSKEMIEMVEKKAKVSPDYLKGMIKAGITAKKEAMKMIEVAEKKVKPTSLKAIIEAEAESLKEIEAGMKVTVVEGKRVTEHSPAYRAFYKENKKGPVSIADWREIAERELEAGRSSIGQVEAFRATQRAKKEIPAKEIGIKELFKEIDSTEKMDRLVRAGMISKQEKIDFIKTLKTDLARAIEKGRKLTPTEGKGVARAFENYVVTSGIKDRIIKMPETQLLKLRLRAERRGAIAGEREGRVETRIKVLEKIRLARNKKALRNKIIKELKNTKIRMQAGKPVGKFTPEVQITLNQLREASKLTKDERDIRIQNNLERYRNTIPPETIALENKIMSIIGGMEEMSIIQLEDILNQVKTIKETGRLTAELKKFNRQANIDMWVDKAIDIITGGKGLPKDISTTGTTELRPDILKEKVKRWIGTTGKVFEGWNGVLDRLARLTKIKPGETWIDNWADVTTQKNAVKKGRRENMDSARKMAQNNLSIKKDRELVKRFQEDANEISLGTFKRADGVQTELIFTKAEARKRWMELQDPSLQETFKEGMLYTEEMKTAIDNFLTLQDKAFAQAQLDFYQSYYNGVNEIYRDIYGVDLPKNENYSPIKREGIERDDSIGFGEFLQEVVIRKSVTFGSLKSRVRNIKPLHKQSDVAILEQHVAEMEHFKGWAHKIRDMRSVFGNPKVRTAIIREHGRDMLNLTDNFLNDFTRGGIEMASRLRWLDKLRSNFSRSVLAVKASIGIKQLTSFIGYADIIPVKEFGIGVADFWSNPIAKTKILRQSEMMKVRGKHMERDIKTVLRSDAYASWRKHPSFLNSLMLNIQIGDQGAIYVGGWSVYKYNRGLGKSHTEALHIFEKETSQVQQSADLDNLSSWQRGSSFAKLFTMFQSAPNMFFRKEMGAIRNTIHGRGSYKQHIKTILIFHFLIPMFFQWVSDFFKWDPDEQKRAAIFGSFNGMFIVSDMLKTMLRYAMGIRVYDTELPIYAISDDVGKALKLIKDDDITIEDVFKAIRGLLGASGALTGIPLKQPIDIGTGAKEILTGEYEQGLAKFLGWSPYIAEKKVKPKGIPKWEYHMPSPTKSIYSKPPGF